MDSLTLKAYAKINLYLRILGRRKDGYHEIETLFERINLCDEITFSSIEDEGIHLDVVGAVPFDWAQGQREPPLPSGPENLCYRAAEQFRKKFGIRRGIQIQLVKKIPIAAGLGGGSSNAAAVLLGLNQWWRVGASRQELLELGGRIGADVPFFLLGKRRAIGKGRGDVFVGAGFKPAPTKTFYFIATPKISVLTKDIYGGWDELNGLTPSSKSSTIKHHAKHTPSEWINDLESVVVRKYQQVKQFADQLRELGLSGIRLSGSGPTFFAELQSQEEGERWIQKVRRVSPHSQVYCVEGC